MAGPENAPQLLDVGIGSARSLSDVGGVGTGAIRPLFIAIISSTGDLIPATLSQPNPHGWIDLGCGITTNGKVSDGQAVTYIVKGQRVCFDLAVGAAAAYKNLRIAYFDNRLARWVFLQIPVSNTPACHTSLRLAPTTFALFGGA